MMNLHFDITPSARLAILSIPDRSIGLQAPARTNARCSETAVWLVVSRNP
jgi:hypothetical protein